MRFPIGAKAGGHRTTRDSQTATHRLKEPQVQASSWSRRQCWPPSRKTAFTGPAGWATPAGRCASAGYCPATGLGGEAARDTAA